MTKSKFLIVRFGNCYEIIKIVSSYILHLGYNKVNFIGNIEGKEIFAGNCNVVVCDGFVGNVTLKTIEGSSTMLFNMIQQEFTNDILAMIIGLLAKPFMKRIYKRIN